MPMAEYARIKLWHSWFRIIGSETDTEYEFFEHKKGEQLKPFVGNCVVTNTLAIFIFNRIR